MLSSIHEAGPQSIEDARVNCKTRGYMPITHEEAFIASNSGYKERPAALDQDLKSPVLRSIQRTNLLIVTLIPNVKGVSGIQSSFVLTAQGIALR